MYGSILRPLLFALSPATAHAAALAALAPVEQIALLRGLVRAALCPPRDKRLVVRTLGLEFSHPLGLAAGFDKNGARPRSLAAIGFAHLELGTVTAQPQAANPAPNLFRVPLDRGLINRLGFPNEGAGALATRLRALRSLGGAGVPLGVSIGKSRATPIDDLRKVIDDYTVALDTVRDVADFIVVNVSSPNTVGLRSMQSQEHALSLLSHLVARAGGRPLLVKVAPDLDDAALERLLAVVQETGLAGVVATNTTIGRAGLATSREVLERYGAGGLSGPPLRQRAVEVVRRVRARLGKAVTVIGVGGVERAVDAIALVQAGANLVQMYTGLVYEGPAAPKAIARGMSDWVAKEGASSVAELVGMASARRKL